MALCGNLAFGKSLGDAGIAAYCVVCYLTPLVYNVFFAVSTSAQPIISFNHGVKKTERVNGTFRYSVGISLAFAACVTVVMCLFASPIVAMFIERVSESFGYAAYGLPLFATSFILNGFNVSAIGYFQSVEANGISTLLMSLRGIVLPVVLFIVMPLWLGVPGLWLAMPVAEALTLVASVAFLRRRMIQPNANSQAER